jgi:hypothetical protein
MVTSTTRATCTDRRPTLCRWDDFIAAARNYVFEPHGAFQFATDNEHIVEDENGLFARYIVPNVVRPCLKFLSTPTLHFDASQRNPHDGNGPDQTIIYTRLRHDNSVFGPKRKVAFIEVKKHTTLSLSTGIDHGCLVDWFTTKGATSRIDRVVNQMVNYLRDAPNHTGALTTYERTWFFHLHPANDSIVFVTPPINRTSTDPSVTRCILYWLSEVMKPSGDCQFQNTFPAQQVISPSILISITADNETLNDKHLATMRPRADTPLVPAISISDVIEQIRSEKTWPRTEISHGGSGVTMRYTCKGHDLALKICNNSVNTLGQQMIQREAEVYERLSSLQGTLIPRCYGVGAYRGFTVLALDFIDSDTFDARRHDADAVYARTRDIIAAARSLGVEYNDLRPENILIERASGRVWLIDFGCAEFIENDCNHET